MKKCKICGKSRFSISFQDEKNKIFCCQTCGFGFLEKPILGKKLKNIYRKEYFDDKKEVFFQKDAERKFNFIKKWILPKEKILDYGCGLGDFIGICKRHNIDICGYDPSSYAVGYVKDKYKADVSGNLEDKIFAKNSFGTVTSFDVIEHEPNFENMILKIHSFLKKDGLLFLTTPNIESWDAKLFGKKWYGFKKIPEHINYFNPSSLEILLKKSNFKLEKIIRNWGFVRSIKFVKAKYNLKLVPKIFDNINCAFPMTDMLIIARKK